MGHLTESKQPKKVPAALPLASNDFRFVFKGRSKGQVKLTVRDLFGGSVFGPHRRYEILVSDRPYYEVAALCGSNGLTVSRGKTATIDIVRVDHGTPPKSITIKAINLPTGLAVASTTMSGSKVTEFSAKTKANCTEFALAGVVGMQG